VHLTSARQSRFPIPGSRLPAPAPVQSVTVTTIGALLDELTPDTPDPRTGRWRDTGVYRGSTAAEWPLLTSLDRLGGTEPPHTKRGLEAHVLRSFIRYSRPHFAADEHGDWELLVAAQHHGVPTRLLDWTYSPLVAAHFATAMHVPEERDRAIWRLDWQRMHEAFGLPRLALLLSEVEKLLGEHGEACTPWALFEREPGRGREIACMIEPPSLDARIVAQSAAFTLTTDNTRAFDAFLEAHGLGDALTRYVIPARMVPRVRDQLDLVGMDERRLFPDIDGVAARIRRYYS
jgi:FRG domain